MRDPKLLVSFSGELTSGYMMRRLMLEYGHEYETAQYGASNKLFVKPFSGKMNLYSKPRKVGKLTYWRNHEHYRPNLDSWLAEFGRKPTECSYEETRKIEELRLDEAKSRIGIGEHLVKVREILGRRVSGNYLKTLDFSRSSAFNYISMYEGLSKKLPKPIFEAAIRRGINSVNMEVLEATPIPKSNDTEGVEEFLSKIEQRPGRKSGDLYLVPVSSDEEIRKCVEFCGRAFDKIGNRGKQKFIDNLGGMLLVRFGIASPKTFNPIALPEKKKAA